MEVKLLWHSPLVVCAKAIRTAWRSFDKSDSDFSSQKLGEVDKALIFRVGNKYKHGSTLSHVIVIFQTDEDYLLEFFKTNPFSNVSGNIVRTNLRVLVENMSKLSDLIYELKDTEFGFVFGSPEVLKDFPHYRIYPFGVVEKFIKRTSKDPTGVPRKIKPFINRYGYPEFILGDKDGDRKHKSLHRLLAETFIQNPDNKKYVNHIDGDKLNYSLSNLEWCTASENEIHSYKVLGKKPWNKGKSLPSGYDYKGTIRPVLQLTTDGTLVREWFSPSVAEKEGGFSIHQISACCLGRQKTHKGFIWRYKNER